MNLSEHIALKETKRTTDDLVESLRRDAVGSDDREIMLEAAARLEELRDDLVKAMTS